MDGVFFTGVMALFKDSMINHKLFFYTVSRVDLFLVRLLGRVVPWFGPGGIMLLVQVFPPAKE